MPYTAVTQIHLTVRQPFWEQDGYPPMMWTDSLLSTLMPQRDAQGRVQSLVCWANGSNAQQLDAMSSSALAQFVQSELRKIRPAMAGKVELSRIVSWGRDPYARGAYSHFGPGQIRRFREQMASPWKRIHFAGEHTAIAQKFPWKDYQTFVDVGTAQGDLAVQIARANSHLQGIGFDLPEVAPVFEEYITAVGVADRLTFVPGNFFKQDFPKADVVLMGHILHDWDLRTKKMLIAKAYDAIPQGGALIVYESIIDDDRSKNAFGLLMSLNMLIETHGGFDYTGADCSEWMKEASFAETRVEPLVGSDSMVIGLK